MEAKFEFVEKTSGGITDNKTSLNTNIINNKILNCHFNQNEIFILESSLCDGKGVCFFTYVTFLENQMVGVKYDY